MKMDENASQEYLSNVIKRLKTEGFCISRNMAYKNQTFDLMARRTRFELEKGGFAATFYLFAKLYSPNINFLRQFSSMSFKCAQKSSGVHLPYGFGFSIWCFPVAIVDHIDTDTSRAIRMKAPPKHWSASEMLVVFSMENRELYYCEITPYWGSLYYDQMRESIRRFLGL